MAKMHWKYEPRPKNDQLYRILVRFPGVGRATKREANKMATVSRAVLAGHHANNAKDPRPDSYIEVEQGSRGVDTFVKLVDPDEAAFQIEHETYALRAGMIT